MACYIIWLLITLTASPLVSQRPCAHFTVVDKHSSQGDSLQKYQLRTTPFAYPMMQKLDHDIAYNKFLQEQENQRELRAEQVLIWRYKQQGIDPVWASPAARNVTIRCTVINFLNGGMLSRQLLPPSPLPDGFYENFENISMLEWITTWNRDVVYYQNQWNTFLRSHAFSSTERQRHERAGMRRWNQYQYSEFRKFIKKLSVYGDYMPEIAAQYEHDSVFAQRLNMLQVDWKEFFKDAVQHIQIKKTRAACAEVQRQILMRQQAVTVERMQMQDCYNFQAPEVDAAEGGWHELLDIYDLYKCGDSIHVDKRIHALSAMKNSGVVYAHTAYELGDDVSNLLAQHNYSKNPYVLCYGNQLQHAIHQECIDLLKETVRFPEAASAIFSQDILVDCIDAAREYNRVGLVSKASDTADFCWALLDYGKQVAAKIVSGALYYGGAVVEGGLQGLLIAGLDVIDHPAQFALCAVAGEYVLAYQLSKVAWRVLDLAVTFAIDPPKAQAAWDGYLASINGILDVITSQEITLHNAVKAGTTLAVCWKAQSKLLKGCNKLYSGAKSRAVEYIKANPLATPKQYLATPDGEILSSVGLRSCPPSCPNQYEKLKEFLLREQFTSITGCTEHALKRLIQRGFNPEDVLDLLYKPHLITTQNDGAKVFIRKIGADKYSFISFNEQEGKIITALKELSLKKMLNLGKGYGWKLETLEI